jgi:Htaa
MMAELRWAVKTSFLDYIAHLPDGVVESDDGVSVGHNEFRFPFEGVETSDTSLVVKFAGRVAMAGHGSFLWVMFAYPRLEVTAEGVVVTLRDTRFEDDRRHAFATLTRLRASADDVVADTALHADATWVFDGRYAAGSPLDPLEMSLPAQPRRLLLDRWSRMQVREPVMTSNRGELHHGH